MKVISPKSTFAASTLTRASVATYWGEGASAPSDAAVNELRLNWNPDGNKYEGVLIEPSVTNNLLNSETLVTQSRNLITGTYTLSFYGDIGTSVLVSGATSSFTLSGEGALKRVHRTFTVSFSGTVNFSVTGTVKYAQCENNPYPTSWVRTAGGTATRAADVLTGSGIFYNNFQGFPDWKSYITFNLGDFAWDTGSVYQSLISDNKGLQPSLYPHAWKNVQSNIEYSSLNTYATGDYCRSNYMIFKSLVDDNTNNPPETSLDSWQYIRSDNARAMLDRVNSVKSIANGNQAHICFKVDEGLVDGFAVLGTTADTVHVAVNKNNGEVITSKVTSPWGSGSKIGGTAAMLGFEPGDVVSIWFTKTDSEVVQVGEIVTGETFTLGKTQYGLKVSIKDYSIKDTDDNGNTILVKKQFSKRLEADLFVDNESFNGVIEVLSDLRAEPCAWIASEEDGFAQGAIVFGFYKDFTLAVNYPTTSLCSLEIEGLI